MNLSNRVSIYLETPVSMTTLMSIKKDLKLDTSIATLKQANDKTPHPILEDILFSKGRDHCNEINAKEPCLSLRLAADPSLHLLAQHFKCESFDEYISILRKYVEASRLDNAIKMLKKGCFQLYAECTDDRLRGIVKSQTDPNLIYACSLTSSGFFYCCTQNLKLCGGLNGAVCKHILVLLVGLAKSETITRERGAHWCIFSNWHQPVLSSDSAANQFLRYKSAAAGEIDWRPLETIPEDYYAF